MLDNLITGSLAIAVCMVIQCVAIAVLLRSLIALELKQAIRPTRSVITGVLVACILILFIGNLIQITLWAGLFQYYDQFESFGQAFYHSMVNFTTLGYGDLIMSNDRKMLGAMEAINGVLMFGLSTGFLYTVLNTLMQRAWNNKIEKHHKNFKN